MKRNFYGSSMACLLSLCTAASFAITGTPSEKVNDHSNRLFSGTLASHVAPKPQALQTPEIHEDTDPEQTTIYISYLYNPNEGSMTEIYRSLSSDIGYELIATIPADQGVYADENLKPRATYYYKLKAVQEAQSSALSNPYSYTTYSISYLPELTATAINENTIELTLKDKSYNDTRYIIDGNPGSQFSEEAIMPDSGSTVTFVHHPANPGTTYEYTVYMETLEDQDDIQDAANATATTPGSEACAGIGSIEWEVWKGISGTDVNSIPVNDPPRVVTDLTVFETPSYYDNNYGARIRGYVCAPQTGEYTFWIASDDNSELWLSSDDDPENKKRIAHVPGHTGSRQWTKYPSQQSASIMLQAGQRYFIEVLHKEAMGADHVAVGWKLPDATLERPIPGIRLIRFDDAPFNRKAAVNITSPEGGAVFTAPADVTITADAWDPDNSSGSVTVYFYNGDTALGGDDTPPYTKQLNDLGPGTYTLIAEAWDNVAGMSDTVTFTVQGAGCEGGGSITREIWRDISGTEISSIPFNTPPNDTHTYASFETPQYFANNYGSRMRGYVCVSSSGDYTFFISSDDKSELWLSTDDNPANATMIAEVDGYTPFRSFGKYQSQVSEEINLVAGSRYYIEVRHKEAGGNDHISVGWRMPDQTEEIPIPGHRLIPFEGMPPVIACADDPNLGSIEREIWRNIPGTSIASIPTNEIPDNVVTLSSLETGTYYANEYGSRIRAYLCVPQDGAYTFWIASDDNSELWLSTNDSPENKMRIASVTGHTQPREWMKYASQQSGTITLEAEQKYYVEVLHKEAGGNDHIAVGWELPDGTMERPIPGNRLILYTDEAATMASQNAVAREADFSGDDVREIRLYPNPTTERDVTLSIVSHEPALSEADVQVVDFTGKIVYAEKINCEKGCADVLLSLQENVPPGLYVVNVLQQDKKMSTRLVIE